MVAAYGGTAQASDVNSGDGRSASGEREGEEEPDRAAPGDLQPSRTTTLVVLKGEDMPQLSTRLCCVARMGRGCRGCAQTEPQRSSAHVCRTSLIYGVLIPSVRLTWMSSQ